MGNRDFLEKLQVPWTPFDAGQKCLLPVDCRTLVSFFSPWRASHPSGTEPQVKLNLVAAPSLQVNMLTEVIKTASAVLMPPVKPIPGWYADCPKSRSFPEFGPADADQFIPDTSQPGNVALRRCPANRFVTPLVAIFLHLLLSKYAISQHTQRPELKSLG